jgi:plastocyanin
MRHLVYAIGFAVLSLAAVRAKAGVDHEVLVGPNSITFEPQTVTINVGDTVTFRSNSTLLHNVHANDDSFRCAAGCENDGNGGSGVPQRGPWQATVRFDHAGYVGYRCDPHAQYGMVGTVHVVEGGASSGFVPITQGFTGTWYDPTQSGHGLFVEVLPENRILAWWFTFTPDGTQAWFGNVGTIAGDTATIEALRTEGGRWIPNFDPASITQPAWGTLTLRFTDCNHGEVTFSSTVPGWGSGRMDLTRLTQPAGLSCN